MRQDHQAVRAPARGRFVVVARGQGRDRLRQVERLEGRPVLLVVDVLRHRVHADVVLVRHEIEPARVRRLELHDHRAGVRGRRALDELFDVDAPADFRAEARRGGTEPRFPRFDAT